MVRLCYGYTHRARYPAGGSGIWRRKKSRQGSSSFSSVSSQQVSDNILRITVLPGIVAGSAQLFSWTVGMSYTDITCTCNANCLGCISFIPETEVFQASHDRLAFKPTAAEVVEYTVPHLESTPYPIVQFGQGCEGEPLVDVGDDTRIDHSDPESLPTKGRSISIRMAANLMRYGNSTKVGLNGNTGIWIQLGWFIYQLLSAQ